MVAVTRHPALPESRDERETNGSGKWGVMLCKGEAGGPARGEGRAAGVGRGKGNGNSRERRGDNGGGGGRGREMKRGKRKGKETGYHTRGREGARERGSRWKGRVKRGRE